MRNTQEPTKRIELGPTGGDVFEHPAYAAIGASRVSGNTNLYDSDFKHQHYMTVKIYPSQLKRNLSNDWHYNSNNPYIEVAMSEAQWATFVSSPNSSPVPCTLQYRNGEMIPGLPAPLSRTEMFGAEQDERISNAINSLTDALELINKSKISGVAKKELSNKLLATKHDICNNQKFVADQFGEHMEKTVERAKVEVNAYATATIHRAGLQALTGGRAILSLGNDEEQP